MPSPAAAWVAVPLFALAVSAQGIIDNMAAFTSISDAAHTFNGDYYVQNVKTGQFMYFDRPGGLTNLIAGDARKTIQLGQDKAYGQSGRVWDHWDGTFFRGLNDKCMSAQWGEQGVDIAGVSYACKVGPGMTGSDSLELAKQLWKLVPCGGGGGGGGGDEAAFSSTSTADFKQLAAVEPEADAPQKAAETAMFESKQDDTANASSESQPEDWAPEKEETQAIDPKDRSTWVCRKDGKWLSEHPEYVTELGRVECKDELEAYVKEHGMPVDDGIDPKDRTTWVCHKDGKWLSEHPDYVWKAGKVECQQRLLDYYAAHGQRKRSHMTKQSKRHAELAKRASSGPTYCIIALDHLTDMTTRALTGNTIPSFGGYLSIELADWNESDVAQHWRVTPA